VAVVIASLWTLIPIYWTFLISVQFERDVYSQTPNFVPPNPTDFFYRSAVGLPVPEGVVRTGVSAGTFVPELLSTGFRNSFIVAFSTSAIAVGIGSLAAYALGRLRFRFKNGYLVTLLASQALPPVAVILPYFVLFRVLGLVGSIYGLIIVYLSLLIPLVTWVLTGFFATLPLEVERAARIDGCGRLAVLRKVILPMAAPGIFAGWILALLIAYNEFVYALILTSGTAAQTIPLAVTALFFFETTIPELGAVVMLTLLPMFVLAFVFQRYITQLRIVDPVTVVIK
jgi:multiple sugar transport system permease protein